MVKKIILFSLIGFVLTGIAVSAAGQTKVLGVDPELINAAIKGKELIFRRRYSEALKVFDKIERDYPETATGFFGKMAIWQVRMFENEDFRFKTQYQSVEKRYEKFARHQLRKGDLPSWELFVYGAADGMRGFFKGRLGKWFKALTHGLHAMRMQKKLRWQEPEFVDSDLSLGMYKYWRSVFTSQLKFLPFFSDQRQEGINMVKRVASSGRYSKNIALANLVFIYYNEKRYDEAISVSDRIIADYPENIVIRYMKGEALKSKKMNPEALTLFQEIYQMDPEINTVLLQQGKILYWMKRYAESKEVLEKFLRTKSEKIWHAVANYYLGLIAETKGDKDSAKGYYETALKFHKLKPVKKRLSKLKI